MIEFIIENSRLILAIISILISLISLLIIAFKQSKSNEPFWMVLARIPSMILEAEKSFGHGNGSLKLDHVLTIAKLLYKSYTGIELSDDSKIVSLFSDAIEEILSTPEKKGKNEK